MGLRLRAAEALDDGGFLVDQRLEGRTGVQARDEFPAADRNGTRRRRGASPRSARLSLLRVAFGDMVEMLNQAVAHPRGRKKKEHANYSALPSLPGRNRERTEFIAPSNNLLLINFS